MLFASKAFPCTAAYRLFAEEGLSCDVAARGELFLALQGGIDPARIYLHGNAKDDADIRAAVEAGVGCVVVDSFDDVDRLERLVGRSAARVPARESRGRGRHARGGAHGPQRLEVRPAAGRRRRDRAAARLGRLELTGLHVHVGSQILELEPFAGALDSLAGLGEFAEYDLGGGLGIPLPLRGLAPSVAAYAETLTGAVRQQLGNGVRLLVEPGRSLVGNAGVTAYRVVSVKRDAVVHVAVDGGMGDNLEPSLYGTEFEARLLHRREPLERCQVVGKHCESGDVLVHDAELPSAQPGDLLVTPATGAYCFTMANNYNGQPRPPVVFCRDGDARLVVRRETLADLAARDA